MDSSRRVSFCGKVSESPLDSSNWTPGESCRLSCFAPEMPKMTRPNHLIDEKSPYLQQHAGNPVEWYPWGSEAFEKARGEDKPIFLSIGYSTCHWCHVMARESFEDKEVANLMNDTFVNIKVDREERPEIDSLYMEACQKMTGSGGWPLTIIMTPNGRPFFAGTYIPKSSRLGLPGLEDLIPRIAELWREDRQKLEESADQIAGSLREYVETEAEGEIGGEDLDAAYHQLRRRYDRIHGGFGTSPKFPTAPNLGFLLRYWKRSGEDRALAMVESTLQSMRRGGIFDQVGFGFHRYSTDEAWLIPHFEKMLYDQALLALIYLEAYQATGREEYADTAREIFTYVLRDMGSAEGAFYSGEDADSEGEEGKFYLWSEKEIRSVLGGDDAALIIRLYGVREGGNFEGSNVLHIEEPVQKLSQDLGIEEDELIEDIERSRAMLLGQRDRRVRPFKDDKVLTDWNGLMIAALAKGSQALGEEYAEYAQLAADFILDRMRDGDGRLLHRYRDGEAGIQATLNDYAFMIMGLIELYEAIFDPQYLRNALEMVGHLIDHFWNDDSGGFYLTPDDGEHLIARQMKGYDGAIPSGNSIAMLDLLRLARITGDGELEERALRIGQAFSGEIKRAQSGYPQMLSALDFALGPSFEIVVAGESGSEGVRKMVDRLRAEFLPNKVVLMAPVDDASSDIFNIVEGLREYQALQCRATAYVCRNFVCREPTSDDLKLLDILRSGYGE